MARPKENAVNNCAPVHIVADALASVKTAPKIGPTQGVQPAPKAIPKTKARVFGSKRFMFFRRIKLNPLIFIAPSIDKPATKTRIPAILVSQRRKPEIEEPIKPKPAPKDIKTAAKPKMNRRPLATIFHRNSLRLR